MQNLPDELTPVNSHCHWTKIIDNGPMPNHGQSVLITCKYDTFRKLAHGSWCEITRCFNILDGRSNVVSLKDGLYCIATHWMNEVELPKDIK